MSENELVELVERVFERLTPDLEGWPDPHPDRQPDDSEYSRVTYAERYRIVGARADAWAAAVFSSSDWPFLRIRSSGLTRPRPTSVDRS